MKRNGFLVIRFSVVILLFVFVGLMGCGTEEDNSFELLQKNQSVIFGDPYEERDQLVDRAEREVLSDLQRDYWWQLATLSRTSANVRLEQKSGDRKYGSATLTSAGLLFSADHIIYNQAHLPSSQSIKTKHVLFKSDWSFVNQSNNFAEIKTDWYMYLRLKSLGLDEWVQYRKQDEFEDFFEQWEWYELENWESDGEDISLIKVEPRVMNQYASLPSWKLLGPGVFFDFKPPTVLSDEEFEKEGQAIQIQHNKPVGSTNDDFRVPLVSYDGTFRNFVSVTESFMADNGTTRNYVLEFTTNSDARRGSSGSALFLNYGYYSNWLNWAGIYSGCAGPNCQIDDPVPFESTDYNHFFNRFDPKHQDARDNSVGNHGEPFRSGSDECVEGDEAPNSCCDDGDPDSCYDECVQYCADPQHASEPRCEKYHCHNPDAPIFEGHESSHEGCVGADCGSTRDPAKVRHLSCTDNRLAKTGNPSTVNDVQGLGVMGAPLKKNVVSKTDTGLGAFGIICGPYSQREWSMNWDFIGVERRRHNRDLLTELLYKFSDAYFNDAYKSAPLSFLNTITRLTREDRLDDGTTVERISPMPFQMCPPGFVMRGLEVQATGSTSSDYIVGVTALRCVDIREPVDPINNACLNTNESEYKEYPCRVPTSLKKIKAVPYRAGINSDPNFFHYIYEDVTQHIGQVDPVANVTEIACSTPGDGVVGFYISKDRNDPTRFIELECMPY